MSSIGSYVFFDLGTTGLPYVDVGDTKITEMTMIGVARLHFDDKSQVQPRIINKLTLCINPMAHIIGKRTGLTNEVLDVMGPFDEKVYKMMLSFIERLPQPVCLLSHYGDNFDFPLLQSHLKSIKMSLPESLLCGDTHKAFRCLNVKDKAPTEWKQLAVKQQEVEEEPAGNTQSTFSPINEIKLTLRDSELNLLLSDGNDSLLEQINEEKLLSQLSEYSTPFKQIIKDSPESTRSFRSSDVRTESTPTSKFPKRLTPFKQIINDSQESTRSFKSSDVQSESTPKVVRCLFPKNDLTSVHKRVTGVNIRNAHTCEADTLAMLNIVSVIGQPFHHWLQENSVLFSTVRRLW